MGIPGLKWIKCLAQGHNSVPPVKQEPTTPLSGVKPSTTEPPHSSQLCTYLRVTKSHKLDMSPPFGCHLVAERTQFSNRQSSEEKIIQVKIQDLSYGSSALHIIKC